MGGRFSAIVTQTVLEISMGSRVCHIEIQYVQVIWAVASEPHHNADRARDFR